MEAATDAKSAVEDAQREQRRKMEESGTKYVPRFFAVKDGRWVPNIKYVSFFLYIYLHWADSLIIISLPSDPKAATAAVQEWIWASSSSSS